MPDSFVETQVRLVLEQQCADVFWALQRGPLADRDFTILLFDYGKGNVAFKTKLALSELVATWTLLLDSWRGLAQRRPVPGLDAEQLQAFGRETASRVPAGCGFALLIGRDEESGYIATANRDDMLRMVGNELLPQWRAGIGVAIRKVLS